MNRGVTGSEVTAGARIGISVVLRVGIRVVLRVGILIGIGTGTETYRTKYRVP